jgi:hypothetical protein
LEAREVWRFREPVVAGRSVVLVRLEDAASCWDDVTREIGDEHYIPVHQAVFCDEGFEVWTWKNGHLAACTIEVGSDRVLMA